jgi:hypothetical protein
MGHGIPVLAPGTGTAGQRHAGVLEESDGVDWRAHRGGGVVGW